MILDAMGRPVTGQIIAYDAYGEVISGQTSILTPIQYAMQWIDDTTGLSFNRARWYDMAGRFTQEDSRLNPVGDVVNFNGQLYCNGNPVGRTDPTGHCGIALSGGAMMGELLLSIGVRLWAIAPYAAAAGIVGIGGYMLASRLASTSASQKLGADWMTSGEPALVSTATLLATNTQAVSDAMNDALSKAVSAGRGLLSNLLKLPIFPIVKSMGDRVYALDVAALAANPGWYVLSYNGAYSWITLANRAAVLAANALTYVPSGSQLDEFPYASTYQGGLGSFAGPVPAIQNAVQGGLLSAFYRYSLKGEPAPFLVVPVAL